jgi:glycosyltransferase involved in cell wall biosynthesis
MQQTNTNNIEAASAAKAKKVLIFIVCYNAEKSIESVLDRIPKDIWESKSFSTEILIIDDQSPDRTFDTAEEYRRRHPQRNLTVLANPKNQGYGGNQKIGYWYAIKKGFDVVVLLHGDGQYAPEYLGQMIEPILDGEADVVLGSRMIHRLDALKGHMPLYKWIGNQTLTFIQNRLMRTRLSEFHTGYRAYSVPALASVPFEHNSNYFDFDTDIIIQMLQTQKHVREIPIPTFYGDEISRVNGIKYGVRIIRSCVLSQAIKLGIYYHPKFDYEPNSNRRYKEKFGYPSSHQFAVDQIQPDTTVLDISGGPDSMPEKLTAKNVKTISICENPQPRRQENSWKSIEANIEEYDFENEFGSIDFILILDVLEHLKSPEKLLCRLRHRFSMDYPKLIITTANVSFLPVRFGLLFGGFHYGNRGILDMDHKRLFTFSTLQRTLEINGYEVIEKRGLPAPFPLAIGDGWLARFLLLINRILIFFSKGLFAYQVAVIAKPLPTLEHLLQDAHEAKMEKLGAQ